MEVTETAYTYDGRRPFRYIKWPEIEVDHEKYRDRYCTIVEGREGTFLLWRDMTVTHGHDKAIIYDFGGSEPDPNTVCECCGRFDSRPRTARSLQEAAEKGYVLEIRWAD